MKKIAYLAVAAVMAATSVYAGGQTMEPTSSDPSWTGFYVGADAGYMWGHSTATELSPIYNGGAAFSYDPDGALGALHVGYEKLFRHRYVLGAEVQGGWMGLEGHRQFPPYVDVYDSRDSVAKTFGGGFGSIVGHLGLLAWQKTLFYFTGGWAWTGIHNTYTDPVLAAGDILVRTTNPTRDGSVLGLGVERAFTKHWSGRAEYDSYNFGEVTSHANRVSNGALMNFRHNLSANSIQLGASYHFA